MVSSNTWSSDSSQRSRCEPHTNDASDLVTTRCFTAANQSRRLDTRKPLWVSALQTSEPRPSAFWLRDARVCSMNQDQRFGGPIAGKAANPQPPPPPNRPNHPPQPRDRLQQLACVLLGEPPGFTWMILDVLSRNERGSTQK